MTSLNLLVGYGSDNSTESSDAEIETKPKTVRVLDGFEPWKNKEIENLVTQFFSNLNNPEVVLLKLIWIL